MSLATSSPQPLSPESVASANRQLLYYQLVSLSWFLYDYGLTLGEEIEFVWWRRWTFPNVLFFLTRYGNFALLLLDNLLNGVSNLLAFDCTVPYWVVSIGSVLSVLAVQVIIQHRIWVMYEFSRKILMANGALFALELCATTVILIFFLPRVATMPGTRSCFNSPEPQLGWVWAPPIALETYLALLAVVKTYNVRSTGSAESEEQLFWRLVHDNLFYSVLVVCVMIANMAFWIVAPTSPGDGAIALVHASGGIAGSRLLLSIRSAAAIKPDSTRSDGEHELTILTLRLTGMSDFS